MLAILTQWNRWGAAKLKSGFPRIMTQKIIPFIDTPEVITLTGIRRSGKTTILYQIMDYLEKHQVPIEAMLHMNFEEPALAPHLKLELLDEIYRSYRSEIYPKGKAYLFFDEIQNVPEWERWVRTRNEREDIKIFITGSSANLMSRELATLLTGRHINFHISPLEFSEFLQFNQIALPKKILPIDPTPEIQHALNQYLTWGGLPEVVLSKHTDRKIRLLTQYFDDILFKDVAMRYQIRDINMLRNIAVHLFTQTASLISINRISKIFQTSLEMARNYCGFLQEAFLVDFLPFYSMKAAERNRHPQKVHVCDLGIRQILALTKSPDNGRLIETAVYQKLQQSLRNNIFYWKDDQEVDFVLRKGNSIYSIIQVAYENLDDPKVLARELNALDAAKQQFTAATTLLVTAKMPKHKDKRILPLWQFLL